MMSNEKMLFKKNKTELKTASHPYGSRAEQVEYLCPLSSLYLIASHLFKMQIADDTSWIIVNETIWNECLVHSVSDNIPEINEEQDL